MQARLLVALAAFAAVEAVTPVQKVIQMLNDMSVKGKAQREAEQVKFSEFKQWCTGTVDRRKSDIAASAQAISDLEATIDQAASNIESLSAGISQLQADQTKWSTEQKASVAQRGEEHKSYQETHLDLSESVDALERAIIVLKRREGDVKQAGAFISKVISLNRLTMDARRRLEAFLQEPAGLDYDAPEANAYEFQSGNVVDLLESLLAKFNAERNTAMKEEMNSKHAHDMTMEDLDGQIRASAADESRKSKALQAAKRTKASSEADHAKTSEMKADDEQYLSDTNTMCMTKSSEYVDRQKLQAEELEAIEQAVGILSSGAVSGAAEKHGVTSASTASTALLQVHTEASNPQQASALAFLIKKAGSLHSSSLQQLTERMEENPFTKVKKMIWDMMNKLQDQANEEAEHKGWCDKEMTVNKQVRTQKQGQVDQLAADKEMLEASIAKLIEAIAQLADDINGLEQAREEATKERIAEKKKNKDTIEDATKAQMAVSKATKVLKTFYAKAATATSLLEAPQDDAPVTWGEAYTGQQGSSTGVLGLLEVVASDFARLETTTTTNEAQAALEYETFMADTKKDIAVKTAMSKNKTAKKQENSSDLQSTTTDLKLTTEQLEAAQRYHQRLTPSCVHQGVSFETRMAQRQEEIESLQTALRILGGEAA